jgi:recombination protein RecT
VNGFEKTVYWPMSQIEKHGKRFSKTFAKGYGLWKDDFDSMAKKTVLKNLISKWGILSIEMQRVMKFDQGVVKNVETEEVEYVDAGSDKSFDDSEPVEAVKGGQDAN